MIVFLPPELKKKSELVKQYKIGFRKYKDGTPDYIKEYDQEIFDYFASVKHE